jgi:hypothetical protein
MPTFFRRDEFAMFEKWYEMASRARETIRALPARKRHLQDGRSSTQVRRSIDELG